MVKGEKVNVFTNKTSLSAGNLLQGLGNRSIIIFDGVCNFCNATVNFIMDRDRGQKFLFVAAQSKAGEMLLQSFGKKASDLETFYLIQANRLYDRSSAVLRVSRHLPFPWKLLYALIIVPAFISDGIYNLIARNRYQWFGKRDSCRLPTPEEQYRFITEL